MHVELEKSLQEHKTSLENRVTTYREQSRLGNRIINLGFVLTISSLLGMFLLVNPKYEWVTLGIAVVMALMAFGFFFLFLGRRINDKKGLPRFPTEYLTADEKIFLKLFDALSNMKNYLNDELKETPKNHVRSEPLRYQVLKYMRETYRLLYTDWQPSNIKVVMKTIGNDIEDFKQEFERSLIYTVEFGTRRENVEVVFKILEEFARFLIDPNREDLLKLKENIKKEQDQKCLLRSDKPRSRYPLVDSILRYSVPQHLMIISIILLSGFAIAFFGVSSGQIDVNTAYLVFVGFSGPSLAAYFGYLLLKWKPKNVE